MKNILFYADEISDSEQSAIRKLLGDETTIQVNAVNKQPAERSLVIINRITKGFERLSNLKQVECDYIVLDEMVNMLKHIPLNKNANFITYGMSSKSAVIPTSIEEGEYTEITYSIQREIKTISNKTIEPFEMPIRSQELDMYSLLYLTTCALYYDIAMEDIKRVLDEKS